MKFIVGIGNQGSEYKGTRHNIGFEVVDAIKTHRAVSKKWDTKTGQFKALIVGTEDLTLVKPALFVNNSGGTVSAIVEKYQTPLKDILIVCDDVNLDFGKLRLRSSGSAGGHHGLESIIEEAGSDFPRLRIGVKNENMPNDLTGFVLESFSKNEKEIIGKIIEKAVSICESWADDGFDASMKKLSQLQG